MGVALRAAGGEETDLEISRRGADTFLWESPLASSVEEAVDMAPGEEQPLSESERERTREWIRNGGKASIPRFLQLSGEKMETVLGYLPELSVYEEVAVRGRRFVLVHAGLEGFSADRPLEEFYV